MLLKKIIALAVFFACVAPQLQAGRRRALSKDERCDHQHTIQASTPSDTYPGLTLICWKCTKCTSVSLEKSKPSTTPLAK